VAWRHEAYSGAWKSVSAKIGGSENGETRQRQQHGSGSLAQPRRSTAAQISVTQKRMAWRRIGGNSGVALAASIGGGESVIENMAYQWHQRRARAAANARGNNQQRRRQRGGNRK